MKKVNSRNPTPSASTLVRGPLSNKAKGNVAELGFLQKASSLGFGVAKPYGDDEHYDFILDSGERFWRVQVRSTSCKRSGPRSGYVVSACRCNHRYEITTYQPAEIDIFAAYIVPLDIWYIIPVDQLASHHLGLHPSGCRGGGCFEAFREAWHLMAPGADLPRPRKPWQVRPSLHGRHFVK